MSATASFFFAISLYPDVQTKAQEELDRVLGRGKIPQFSDRSSLPYIEAIYREVMRRHPTVPTGWHLVIFLDINAQYGQLPRCASSYDRRHHL